MSFRDTNRIFEDAIAQFQPWAIEPPVIREYNGQKWFCLLLASPAFDSAFPYSRDAAHIHVLLEGGPKISAPAIPMNLASIPYLKPHLQEALGRALFCYRL